MLKWIRMEGKCEGSDSDLVDIDTHPISFVYHVHVLWHRLGGLLHLLDVLERLRDRLFSSSVECNQSYISRPGDVLSSRCLYIVHKVGMMRLASFSKRANKEVDSWDGIQIEFVIRSWLSLEGT